MAEYLTLEDVIGGKQKNYLTLADVQPLTADPTDGMSGMDKFRAGMGKAMVDTARGAGQWVGLVNRDDVKESRRLDKSLMDTGAGMAGNFAGGAAMFAPTAMIPGANTITGAGLIGAGMGLLQPSASTNETFSNAGIGGVAGAAIPAATRALRVGKSLVEPFYQGGRDQIIGRAITNAAGNQSDDAMRNLVQSRPLVAGTLPTAGEAARNPGIAALQRTAIQTDPVAMGENFLRQQANGEARIEALRGLVPDRAAAVTARDAATNPLYEAAKKATVQIDEPLQNLLNRPAMKSAMSRAQQLAQNSGESLDFVKAMPSQASVILGANGAPVSMTAGTNGSMSGRAAHYMKMALDDMANAPPASGIAGNELRSIRGTLDDFLTAIEKQVPEYGQARTTYKSMSAPITQADVAEEILRRSTNNVPGNMTPAAFHRALQDKTAQSVTGQKNQTLAKVFTPDQLRTLNGVSDDLANLHFAQTAGKGVGSDTVQKLAFSNMMDSAGIPSFIRNFGPAGVVGNLAQRFGQVGYADANRKLSEELARSLLDPRAVAELMGRGAPGLLGIESAVSRAGLPITGGLLSGQWAQ